MVFPAKCKCDSPNVVHQGKCMGCNKRVGYLIDDDYCTPTILYCPDCMTVYCVDLEKEKGVK